MKFDFNKWDEVRTYQNILIKLNWTLNVEQLGGKLKLNKNILCSEDSLQMTSLIYLNFFLTFLDYPRKIISPEDDVISRVIISICFYLVQSKIDKRLKFEIETKILSKHVNSKLLNYNSDRSDSVK